MNERVLQALNPTSGGLLEGAAGVQVSSLRVEDRRQRGNVNVDHVVVDDSIRRPNPTAVPIGVPRGMSRPQLWRSTAIGEWSRKAGVEHLPAIFGGEPVEHINLSAREAGVNPEFVGVR